MLLLGKPVAEHLFAETKERVTQHLDAGTYVLFFLLSDNAASQVYVQKKCAYAQKLGLQTQVIDDKDLSTKHILEHITSANDDSSCIGMVIQLPLSSKLQPHQATLLCALDPKKDIDGLGGVMLGQSLTRLHEFIPATPKAVVSLLDWYGFGELKGKIVTIIGQSNLIGKPLAAVCMDRGATVLSFNASSDKKLMQMACTESDIIVTATGVTHLLTPSFFAETEQERRSILDGKVIIDVGRGIQDGKAVGDTDRKELESYGALVTPVPGGIGPVTVASLFHNLIDVASLD